MDQLAPSGPDQTWQSRKTEEPRPPSGRNPRAGSIRSTFYVATSFTNRERARQVAGFLEHRGLRWVFGHDWTTTTVDHPDDPRAPLLAQQDLRSAIAADLFILLPVAPLTVGCHTELGARIGVGKEAHLVRDGLTEWHLFHSLPGVIEHKSIEDFVFFALGS